MKEKIHEILKELNRGRIAVDQAHHYILELLDNQKVVELQESVFIETEEYLKLNKDKNNDSIRIH